MLRKKMMRDIRRNFSSFITIFIMTFLGVFVFRESMLTWMVWTTVDRDTMRRIICRICGCLGRIFPMRT